jgi:hypothetical protein
MHYRNGREAKVGDRVVGRTYNEKGQVAGTLISLTPGQDSCSAKVGYLELVPLDRAQSDEFKASSVGFCGSDKIVAIQGTENHGNAGPVAVTRYREDYTHAQNLWHADDAYWANEAGDAVQPPKSE